ncbi:MAG: hypothetical protein JEZ07_19030 [Phycisphaerae bacterium]|nr:hypothetical protein [Phycisphaerae bacterium]
MEVYRAKYVIELIHEAFGDLKYPGTGCIKAKYADESEIDEFYYRNKVWQKITINDINNRYFELPFLAPGGLRFFLPAFIVNGINYTYDVPLFCLLSRLTAPRNSESKEYVEFQNYFRGYDVQQMNAIRYFLNYILLVFGEYRKETQEALDSYWDEAVIRHWKNLFL